MLIVRTANFSKRYKKLHDNERKQLDSAIRDICADPSIGSGKKGKLSSVLIHKFMMNRQLILVAYTYKDEIITLTLIKFGPHENFYRDLENSL